MKYYNLARNILQPCVLALDLLDLVFFPRKPRHQESRSKKNKQTCPLSKELRKIMGAKVTWCQDWISESTSWKRKQKCQGILDESIDDKVLLVQLIADGTGTFNSLFASCMWFLPLQNVCCFLTMLWCFDSFPWDSTGFFWGGDIRKSVESGMDFRIDSANWWNNHCLDTPQVGEEDGVVKNHPDTLPKFNRNRPWKVPWSNRKGLSSNHHFSGASC